LAVAFVFTGRMEAATAHCARVVAEEQAAAEPQHGAQPEAMSCHDMDEAAPAPEQTHHQPAKHNPAKNQCECVAVLAGFTTFAPSISSTHIEPYEWVRPEAAVFASVEPSPGLRPPRA